MWTYNPKNAGTAVPTHLPLDLFPKQRDLIRFFDARLAAREDGLVEKGRDLGFTWCAGGYAVHKWLFVPGFKTNFGSMGADEVDKAGDPDSIFEKIRMLVAGLPIWMLPDGFSSIRHSNYMRLVNPENANAIVGEVGDEMGRGGRATMFFLDEFSRVDRADRVESATSANSDVRIFGSTVNGAGNLFFRKRHGGILRSDQIFRLHYTDDPRKGAAWVAKEKARLEPHVWAAEHEIDYSASVEGIAIPARWVEASRQIAAALAQVTDRNPVALRIEPAVKGVAGQDVGAGKAKSVFVPRFGCVVGVPIAWGDPDTTETAFRSLDAAGAATATRTDGKPCKIVLLRYDEVGVGKGVLSILSNHKRQGLITAPVNVGMPPSDTEWPDGNTSAEKFANLKAEVWWLMRDRFKSTHEMLLFLLGEPGGIRHSPSDLIVLPPDSDGPDAQTLAMQLSLVKWFRNEKGRIIMESKSQLAHRGIVSPDHADALALTFDPDTTLSDWYGAFG